MPIRGDPSQSELPGDERTILGYAGLEDTCKQYLCLAQRGAKAAHQKLPFP